jgi:hypothetical protein
MITRTKLKWGAFAIVGALAGGACLISVQKEAAAGYKTTAAVDINTTARWAHGSIGSARNSSSGLEYIGCSTYYSTLGGSLSTFCQARMAGSSPPIGTCTTTNSTLVEQGRSINGDSYIEFEWDASGQCTSIMVDNFSNYAPKSL